MLNRFYHMRSELAAEEPEQEGSISKIPFGIGVAYVLDGRPGQVDRLLKHQYSKNGNYPFCLVIRGKEVLTLVQEAMLLFFHPAYAMADKGRRLFIAGGEESVWERVSAMLREQQLDVEVLTMADVKILYADGRDPGGDYYRYCTTNYSARDVFLLEGGDLTDWSTALGQVDHKLASNDGVFYRLASERVTAGELAAVQARELRELREESKIMRELLELNARHNEVNDILKFYHNEYEVLPLWYKRAGHLIKVIQGKRSFRSLFDKSVKKYKE